jgi:hypothetical protein
MVKLIRGLEGWRGALISTVGLVLMASMMMLPSNAAAAGHHNKGKYAIAFHGDGGDTAGTGILVLTSGGVVTGTLNINNDGFLCQDSVSGSGVLNPDGVTGTLNLIVTFVSSSNGSTASDCGTGDILTFAFARDQNKRTLELAEMGDYSPGTFAADFNQVLGLARKQAGGKLKGTYGFQYNGDASDFATGTGALSVDKTGAVSGSMFLNNDGCICFNTLTGVAIPSGDGVTGTMALTSTNVLDITPFCTASECGDASALTLGTALDNGGKEVQFGELDDFSSGNFAKNVDIIYGVMHRVSGK